MYEQSLKYRHYALFFCILVYVSGAIGMLSPFADWFIAMTPLSLLLSAFVLVWHQPIHTARTWAWIAGAYLVGFFSEVLGVNTGMLFGVYQYGTTMGPKLWETPLMIGINWLIVTYCVNELLWRFLPRNTSTLFGAILAAAGCTAFDWVIEPVAIWLGYWSWEEGIPPVENYTGWFTVSFVIALAYKQQMTPGLRNRFAPVLLVLQVLFFLFLQIFHIS
jgi:bisanhydrobacterioruberin hydratase